MAQESGKVAAQPKSAADDRPPSTEELRARIEVTRGEIGETIDAIQDRLSPKRVIADVTDKVKDATIGRVERLAHRTHASDPWSPHRSEQRLDVIRRHPVATALIGAGAAGLTYGLWRWSARKPTDIRRSTRAHSETSSYPTRVRRNKPAFLLGTCASLACWGMWRVKNSSNAVPPVPSATTKPVEMHDDL
jgi:hypothetical protein